MSQRPVNRIRDWQRRLLALGREVMKQMAEGISRSQYQVMVLSVGRGNGGTWGLGSLACSKQG